jgi:hypothetical protein
VKVDKERADPARKDDPQVDVDSEILDTMKGAIKRVEALVVVSAVAMKKAKTEADRDQIKHGVHDEMKKTVVDMRTKMKELKKKSVMLMTLQALKAEDEQYGYTPGDGEPGSGPEDRAHLVWENFADDLVDPRIPKLRQKLESHYAKTYGKAKGADETPETEDHDDEHGDFKALLNSLDKLSERTKKAHKDDEKHEHTDETPAPKEGSDGMGQLLGQLDALKGSMGIAADGNLRSH